MSPELGAIVSVAGRSLSIETTSPAAFAAIAPSIAHLGPGRYDGERTRWAIVEEAPGWDPRTREFAETGAYRVRGGGFAVVQADPPSLERYDPETGIELRVGSAALRSGDLRAHPGLYALATWLTRPGLQIMHAGAVSYDGAAALIIGPGGVGKSTSTLACALAGAGFLGDDAVLVDAKGEAGRPVVHCLFATAKLNSDSAGALGCGDWPELGVTRPKLKRVVAVNDHLTVARSAPIAALIVLGAPTEERPRPRRLRTSEVLASLVSTAAPVSCRTGSPADWLSLVAALARDVPGFRLPVSWKLDAVAAAIREVVTDAGR